MHTKFERVELVINESEARTLLYNLRRGLEYTIDSHWLSHPTVWREHEAERLQMIRTLSGILGEDYEYFVKEAQARLDKLTASKAA